jgi:hypothetical protein
MIENDSFDLRKFLYSNQLLENKNTIKKSDLKNLIKEEFNKIREAKKDEESDEDIDLDSEDETNVDDSIEGLEDMDFESDDVQDMPSDESFSSTGTIEPEIEEIQKILIDLQTKAAELAKNNPNPKDPKFAKFSTQIANTIKYFTSDFIADTNTK